MAILNNRNLTMKDLADRLGPDNKQAAIIELLSETNPILQDMPFIEGNLPYGHQFGVRRYLPRGTWRRLYEGVKPTKSAVSQVVAQAARIEAYIELDAALPGDIAAARQDEVASHIEGIGQQIATSLFYGDARTNPSQFNGLGWHYSSKSSESGQNIIDAGGTGNDNRSIWLIGWGDNKVCGFYPKARTGYDIPTGTTMVSHENLGRQTSPVLGGSSGELMEVYRDHLTAELGLVVKDWRYAARIANIDVSDLKVVPDGTGNAQAVKYIEDLVLRAVGRFGGNSMSKGSIVGYCDRELLTWINRQVAHRKAQYLPWNQKGGVMSPDDLLTTNVSGVFLRPCDALNVDEARVT